MLKLIQELKLNEKLMKRVEKDKENGLREATLSILSNKIFESEWWKAIEKNEDNKSRYDQIRYEESFMNEEFYKKVFEELTK
jgi:hypothetical protein